MHRVSQWFRSLYLVILILTILLCPISYGWLLPLDRAAAGVERQIDFTPQVTPLALTQTAQAAEFSNVHSPLPDLPIEPGNYYEGNDPSIPEVIDGTKVGDARFGYGQLLEDPSLYLVWITEAGIRKYLVLESTSNVLTGGPDPKMGFFQLAAERENILNKKVIDQEKRDTDERTTHEFQLGTGIASTAWAVCAIVTGGLCTPFIGIAAGVYWISRSQNNKVNDHQIDIDGAIRDIAEKERHMRGKFTVGMREYGQE